MLLASAGACVSALASPCESLVTLKLGGATITTAESVAGSFTPPSESTPLRGLPRFCRVAAVLEPSSDSHIEFELWMPSSGWKGKFYGAGSGAYSGSIHYQDLAVAVRHGYAAASTDTGHKAPELEGSWALGHPEKVIDFGYRAIHETAETSKALIRAFYSRGPERSYFYGCSGGGRQALMEAQRYPADYDGIIAGAPGYSVTRMTSLILWTAHVTHATPESSISPAKLPAIEAAALAACDAADGLRDGLIENPPQCRFDPSVLLCRGPETDACLTASQVMALKQIYAGPKTAAREQFMPGFSPGGESAGRQVWVAPAAGRDLVSGAAQFFSHMVYEDPSWNVKNFDLERDTEAAKKKLAKTLDAADTNLEPFRAHGGKLILYQGWSDGALPPLAAIQYYDGVVTTMSRQQADSFMRLFMAPGMAHCGGGIGPNSFGQHNVAQADAEHNLPAALERWVEQGIAPDLIIATKYKQGTDSASGVQRTRPLCPYPLVARYKGRGSIDEAESFVCAK
jgi:feruloyl esterase